MSKPENHNLHWIDDDTDTMWQMYLQGYTPEQIGRRIGRTPGAVRKHRDEIEWGPKRKVAKVLAGLTPNHRRHLIATLMVEGVL